MLGLIKDLSQPLPNSTYTQGLTDENIAWCFVDTWLEDKFAEYSNINVNVIFSKNRWFISIYDIYNIYYSYTWSIAELRQWNGYVGSRSY